MAHKDYLAYIYTDRAPRDFEKAKRALKKNLEFGRRWAILVNGYVNGDVKMPGLGLGVLLICGPSVKKKMLSPPLFKKHALTRIQLRYENAALISKVTSWLYP
jgi:hypothetical protein